MGNSSKILSCLVILDDQSNSSFVDPKVCDFFEANFPTTEYNLTTLSGQESTIVRGQLVGGLFMKGRKESAAVSLPNLLTSCFIPNTKNEIATPREIRRLSHLAHIANHFVAVDGTLDVLFLLGRDCSEALDNQTHGK